MHRTALGVACAILTTTAANAATLNLSFANPTAESVPGFNSDVEGEDTIEFGVVGNDGTTDIYADLTRVDGVHLKGTNAVNNGSRNDTNFGDVGVIHGAVGTSAVYELTLYSDAYMTQYSNANGFDWSLTFLDIDGGNRRDTPNFYDEIVLFTPGTATVAGTNVLNQSIDANGNLVFDGANAGEVDGTATDGLSTDALMAAVGYTLTDTAQMTFGWNVQEPGFNDQIDGFQRTLFFSGDLLIDGDDVTTIVVGPTPVPLPASALLLIAGLGGLAGVRRFSKA